MGFALLLLGGPWGAGAQWFPQVGPPFEEVRAAWEGVWARLAEGDLAGARRYLHSARRHLFPGGRSVAELQELGRQMRLCRLEPMPLPISEEEVVYEVRCAHGGERAEGVVSLRRDVDGVWRFVAL